MAFGGGPSGALGDVAQLRQRQHHRTGRTVRNTPVSTASRSPARTCRSAESREIVEGRGQEVRPEQPHDPARSLMAVSTPQAIIWCSPNRCRLSGPVIACRQILQQEGKSINTSAAMKPAAGPIMPAQEEVECPTDQAQSRAMRLPMKRISSDGARRMGMSSCQAVQVAHPSTCAQPDSKQSVDRRTGKSHYPTSSTDDFPHALSKRGNRRGMTLTTLGPPSAGWHDK